MWWGLVSNAVNKKDLDEATQTLKEVCSVKNKDLLPYEKFEAPITSTHEIGWHTKTQLVRLPLAKYSFDFLVFFKLNTTFPHLIPRMCVW